MESGTGIKNKLLEAMAAGAPAVATPLACQGIDAAPRRWSPTPTRTFAAGARRAAARPPSAPPGMAEAAREYVRARHDWDAVAAAYLALYESDRAG